MERTLPRRLFAALAATGALTLTGCAGGVAAVAPGTSTPTPDPSTMTSPVPAMLPSDALPLGRQMLHRRPPLEKLQPGQFARRADGLP